MSTSHPQLPSCLMLGSQIIPRLTRLLHRPDVGSVFYVGDWCRLSWANPSGPGWSSVKIQLMSGIETAIMNVATDLDCSSSRSDSLVFRCPDVTN